MFSGRQMMACTAGLGLAVALGFGFIVWPNYREVMSINRQLADLRGKVQGLHGQTAAVEKLAENAAKARMRVEGELKVIPDVPDIAGLIRKLSQEVDHITVVDQTFTAGSANDALVAEQCKVQAMPLTVDMEATFESVFALLRNAESMPRLVRVASVHLLCKRDDRKPQQFPQADSSAPVLRASVGLEAIYEPVIQEGK